MGASGRSDGNHLDAGPDAGVASGDSRGAGAGGSGLTTDRTDAPGGTVELTREDACIGVDIASEGLPVDMYIMLDKSTSMAERLPGSSASKWEGAIAAIQAFLDAPFAAGHGVGIQYFGQPDACDIGAYATPDVPIARIPEVTTAIIDSTNSEAPATLSPTAPALEGALQYMQERPEARPDRASVVVLATDGLPTECGVSCGSDADCSDEGATCVAGMCEPDSIAAIAAIAEQYAGAELPIHTVVIALGEALEVLDPIASDGRRHGAFYIESGDVEEAFLDALLAITSTPLPCEFDFPHAPSDSTLEIDNDLVALIFTPDRAAPAESIPRVVDEAACATSDGEGWWYDDNDDPTRLVVCPGTCERLMNGRITILVGCTP